MLSAFRRGGRSEAKTYLKDFAASGAPLHGDGALLAIRVMLLETGEGEVTLTGVRDHLRAVNYKNDLLQLETLNLARSLRVAEVEEHRQVSVGLKPDVILNRKRAAWQNVLEDLIAYADAVEAREVVHDGI